MDRPKLSLLTGNHRITTGAAEAAGLTPEERIAAQRSIDASLRRIEKWVGENAKPDEQQSQPESHISIYDIKARPDRGASLREEIKMELVAAVGQTKGETLFEALDTTIDYGGYGRYDARVKFYPNPSRQSDEIVSETVYTNPDTGAVTLRTSAVLSSFKQRWGDSFEFN